jgi:hypothetical protein
MGVGRLAPHRIRAAYARALAEIPLPVRYHPGLDPAALTFLAEATVADRSVRFGTLAHAPKLWVAFAEVDPPVLGYLSGLAAGDPEIHVTDPVHVAWSSEPGHATALKRAAMEVWQAMQRECDG